MQIVRDLVSKKVYPAHRLDRKTSGVLVFALNPEINKCLQEQFQSDKTTKEYKAIVRGYFPEEVTVDYPVINARNKLKDAVTIFKTVSRVELPIPLGKHDTSRYSYISAQPKTGRMHQIRRHCNHLRHPIIGDRPHGCSKQNRLFKERWSLTDMMLHAHSLSILHPISDEPLILRADFPNEFIRIKNELGL